MTSFASSLHSCQHYSSAYEAMIDESSYGDIIKLIQLINILTTWALWSEQQKEGKVANVIQRYYTVIRFIDLGDTFASYRLYESVNSYPLWIKI